MQPHIWTPLADGDTLSFGGTVHVQRKARSVRNPFVYVVGMEGKSNAVSHNSTAAVTCDRQDENSATHVNRFVKVLHQNHFAPVLIASRSFPTNSTMIQQYVAWLPVRYIVVYAGTRPHRICFGCR
jgi:hypothetical protein